MNNLTVQLRPCSAASFRPPFPAIYLLFFIGVSGPWYVYKLAFVKCCIELYKRWYGVGGTIQLAFFAMVAAKVKMNANGAHTFLEVSVPRVCLFLILTVSDRS